MGFVRNCRVLYVLIKVSYKDGVRMQENVISSLDKRTFSKSYIKGMYAIKGSVNLKDYKSGTIGQDVMDSFKQESHFWIQELVLN